MQDDVKDRAGRPQQPETPPSFVRGTNYLLAIAIDDYQHYRKLHNCVRDVTDIKNELVERYDFEEEHVRLLLNSEANHRNILKALDECYRQVGEHDSFIFIFSGHGENLEGRNIGSLIPVDAEDEYGFLDLSVIKNRLDSFRAKHILVIFDSCFSGLLLTHRNIERLSNIPENYPSRFAITSGRNSPVSDGFRGENSPFIDVLLTKLRDNNDKMSAVTLSQAILDFFRVRGTDQNQLPDFGVISSKAEFRGQYYFYPKNYEETLVSQRREINELKEAIEIIEQQKEELATALRIAKSQTLAAKALLLKSQNPTIALRLAEAGYKSTSSKECANALCEIVSNPNIGFYQESIIGSFEKIVFSPNHRFVAFIYFKGLILWDDHKELQREITSEEGAINSVAFSPSNEYFLTTSDETAQLRDLEGNVIQTFEGHQEPISCLAFSSSGEYILTGSYDNTAKLWDLRGKIIREFTGHKREVTSITFSPDGKFVLTGCKDGIARLWRLNDTEVLNFYNLEHQYDIISVAFSPNGRFFLTGSSNEVIKLWDIIDGNWVILPEFCSFINSNSFSPNGEQILFMNSRRVNAGIINLPGFEHQIFSGHKDQIHSACFSPDGTDVITASHDRTIKIWCSNGKPVQSFNHHKGKITALASSPNGNFFLTGSEDKTAVLWSWKGKVLQVFSGHSSSINFVAFSPDGQYILTSSKDENINLWDIKGRIVRNFLKQEDYLLAVSFTSNGIILLTSNKNNNLNLWDFERNLLNSFSGHKDTVLCGAFSPDGKYIITGSADETAKLWDLEGNILQDFNETSEVIRSVSFSPNGKFIFVGSITGSAKLYSSDGTFLQQYSDASFNYVTFSDDSSLIFSGRYGYHLWDLAGNKLQSFEHIDDDLPFALSLDKKYILFGGKDGTVQIWRSLFYFLDSTNVATLTLEHKEAYGIDW